MVKFDLLLSFPNIWTVSQFQRICLAVFLPWWWNSNIPSPFSVFLNGICYFPTDSHCQHRRAPYVCHLISAPSGFLTILMGYSEAKLKSNGDNAPPYFWTILDRKCIILTSFMGTWNSMNTVQHYSPPNWITGFL
jgi:hypothetical protein